MNKKYISQLKAGDIVQAHGGTFLITENARYSTGHGSRSWESGKGFTYFAEAPDCAIAKSVCLTGEVKGYFEKGTEWTFQGNFKAGQYTLVNS